MKKNLKILSVAMLGLMAFAWQAAASEISGELKTGVDTGINGTVIVAPTATPAAGTYTAAQDVVLSASGASSIYYTFDGSAPDCVSALKYQVAVPVDVSRTIKALSCYANGNHSSIASFAYVINITTTTGGGGGGGGSVTPVQPTGSTTGDIDGNGSVNKYDFALMMANWGSTSGGSSDLNHDGTVDKYDFSLMMANWSAN